MKSESLEKLFSTLKPNHRLVMRLKYGLIDGIMHTNESIANILDIAAQNVGRAVAMARKELGPTIR